MAPSPCLSCDETRPQSPSTRRSERDNGGRGSIDLNFLKARFLQPALVMTDN
jgi:hypothetical protein